MDLINADIKDVYHLCVGKKGNDEKGVLNVKVPYYQRPYKWGADQISELFHDYADNKKNASEKKSYFLGSVVMVQPKDDTTNPFEIVDGQQRVTTLFLLNYIKYLLL